MEVGRVIGTAHQWTGRHVLKAFRAGNFTVGIEAFRWDKLDYGKMLRSRPEILTQREHLTTDFAQVVHRLEKFRPLFAEPEHHSAFCDDLGGKLLRFTQDVERGPIFRARTHGRRQPFDGFHVVIEDVGRGLEDDLDAPFLGVKVGNQNLYDNRGIHRANRLDRACKMIRATIFQIVSGDGGNDDVLQTHPAHRLRDAPRFILFQRERFSRSHGAKSAGPGAACTRDHHRRGALAPTFPAIRALRAFTDGVQPQVRDEGFGGKENRIRGQSNFDPWRFLRLVQRRIDFRAGHHGEAIRADKESNRGGTRNCDDANRRVIPSRADGEGPRTRRLRRPTDEVASYDDHAQCSAEAIEQL